MILQELSDEKIFNLGSMIAIGVVLIIISLIALWVYVKQRTRVMLFFFMAWTAFGIYIIMNGISMAFDVLWMFKISYVVFLPVSIILWFFFVDQTMHESIGIKKMIVAFSISTFFAAFVLLEEWIYDPEMAGYYIGSRSDLLNIVFFQLTNIVLSLTCISYTYWVTMTFKKSPSQMRKKTSVLFVFGIFMIFGAIIQFTADLFLLLVQSIIVIIVMTGTSIVIKNDPRIASLLPYTVYKLIITSKNGPKYYTKAWTDSGIDDDMLAGLMSAIGTVVKNTLKTINTGAISEIKMYKGVMLTEMRYMPVNIVLVASKTSIVLKSALEGFSEDFTKVFYNDLYDKDGFAKEVLNGTGTFTDERMNPIIDKYFHNIPSFEKMM